MKRPFRVKDHREFDRIIRNGKRIKSSHFNVYYEPSSPEQNHSRVGIAVGKANGIAVVRVKQKRQVRAMLASDFDFTKPFNIIIAIKPSYKIDEFAANQDELRRSLEQIRESSIEKQN